MVDGMRAVLLLDALDERTVVVALAGRHAKDDVDASLVERHGVERGEDAVVLEFHWFGRGHTVAVDGHVVHHRDIDDALAIAEEVVHGLSGSRHRLEEPVLIFHMRPESLYHLLVTGGVDVGLSVGRCHADGGILEHATETTHGMSLEVCEVDHEVVVGQVLSHDIIFNMCGVVDRNGHIALLVHEVDLEGGQEAMILDGLPMLLEGVSLSLISRVAFHDRAIHLVDKEFDEFGLEVVGIARLSGRDFHCHLSCGRSAERMIDLHQCLGRYFLGEIDSGLLAVGLVGCGSLLCGRPTTSQQGNHHNSCE